MNFEREPIIVPEAGQEELTGHMRSAYEKVLRESEKETINLHDFDELYSPEEVDADIAEIQRREGSFENDTSKQIAEICEAIIIDHAYKSEWLGPTCDTARSSKYDDYCHGVDMIAEYPVGEQGWAHFAFGIDVTYSRSASNKKLETIKREIDNRQLGEVKYYENDQGMRKHLEHIPHLVVGFEKDTVEKLAGLWVQEDDESTRGKASAELGRSEVKYTLLAQIKIQLETFLAYTQARGFEKEAAEFARALDILEPTLAQLEEAPEDGNWANDNVLKDVQMNLKLLFKNIEDNRDHQQAA